MKGMLNLIVVTLVTAALATGCASVQVTVDHDAKADFSKYESFVWKAGTPAENQLVQRRIESAIAAQLDQHGISETESEADLFVITHASVDKETRVYADSYGYGGRPGYGGYGWGGGWGTSTVNVTTVDVGMLIVDLVDVESNDLVWRAVGTGTVNKNPEKSEVRINDAAARMFQDFPPQ